MVKVSKQVGVLIKPPDYNGWPTLGYGTKVFLASGEEIAGITDIVVRFPVNGVVTAEITLMPEAIRDCTAIARLFVEEENAKPTT